jgi:hypothetical protein
MTLGGAALTSVEKKSRPQLMSQRTSCTCPFRKLKTLKYIYTHIFVFHFFLPVVVNIFIWLNQIDRNVTASCASVTTFRALEVIEGYETGEFSFSLKFT